MHPLRAALLLACMAPGARPAAPAFEPDLATLAAVPRVEVPAAAVRKALDEPIKGRPYQIAVAVDMDLSEARGQWESRGARRNWRLRLGSPGARTLSLHLEASLLPEGSQLWVYDPAARLRHGPYFASKIAADGLWTPPVGGDELVLEVRAPAGTEGIELGAVKAFHGFRDWDAAAAGKAAGACNIDITCPAAAAWTQDGRAVARILIGNAFLCSGQLVNNVLQDKRRLFLTANHCGVGDAGSPASSVVFYFGYEGPCTDNGPDPVPAPTFQGSQRLARDLQSDFALLEITDPAALPSTLFFAGWDATGAGSASGVAIHHPDGDEKKIAFFTAPVSAQRVNLGFQCGVDAWEVQWSSGTTEPGSSGGGLWNSDHRLIGVLSGGGASCATPAVEDYFARLDRGWTARSAASGQLKAHLDPNDSCVAIVPGLEAAAASPGPVAPAPGNTACSGDRSTCPGGGGGGALDALALALLLGAAVRRSRRA
ncbi:MAG: trypsin-like serine peptidase [Gammaproteobacteria bacterium]